MSAAAGEKERDKSKMRALFLSKQKGAKQMSCKKQRERERERGESESLVGDSTFFGHLILENPIKTYVFLFLNSPRMGKHFRRREESDEGAGVREDV